VPSRKFSDGNFQTNSRSFPWNWTMSMNAILERSD
jgi:hypothetical protein